MSASNKKKLRKEQEMATMTKKQKAAKKEARKLAVYTASFWIVLALCVSIVLGLVLETPVNVAINRADTAITVGDHKITTTELTYFYIDAINQWYGTYGSYASMFGLSTSTGLDQQMYDKETGVTWADYFLDMALDNAKRTYALCDAADAANFTMSEEDQGAIDSLYTDLKAQAKEEKMSVTKYLQNIYGDNANEKTYKKYYEATAKASAYYYHYQKNLKDSYTDEALREFEGKESYKYNSYTYASFYLSLDNFKIGGTKDEKGKITYSEDELKAAEEYLKRVKDELSAEGIDTVEKLNEAIAKMEAELEAAKEANPPKDANKKDETSTDDKTTTEGDKTTTEDDKTTSEDDKTTSEDDKDEDKDEDKEDDKKEEEEDKPSTATENKKVLYSKVTALMQEWIRDEARSTGDITALIDETTSKDKDGKETKTLKGYYIVLFQECHDNYDPLADVRHILVKYEGGKYNSSTGQTTYSDAEKKAAKEKAEKLLEEWKNGDANEDSFAAMANKHSADGDGTTGGLYENVYPGQMVTNFNDWCFDDIRKEGDTGVVESTYGYHVMYYVGDSEENYRDYMVTNDKLSEEMEEWETGLIDGITLVEKNVDRLEKDLVLSPSSSNLSTDHDGHDH